MQRGPVNSDPAVLDGFYKRMLGRDGDKVLSEEVKWLAVTHKSFDQGRRGFNDRLAFLGEHGLFFLKQTPGSDGANENCYVGKQIVQLQASLSLAQGESPKRSTSVTEDEYGRIPPTHDALKGLGNLSSESKHERVGKTALANLAKKYEADVVARWTPTDPRALVLSGQRLVLAQTMYAIVGAVALERGGVAANQVAQKQILEPLGFKTVP